MAPPSSFNIRGGNCKLVRRAKFKGVYEEMTVQIVREILQRYQAILRNYCIKAR